jgi:hypothetical protein
MRRQGQKVRLHQALNRTKKEQAGSRHLSVYEQQQQQDQAAAMMTAPLGNNKVELIPDLYKLHHMAIINLMKYLS